MLSHEMSSQSGDYSASAKKDKGSIKTRESTKATMNILAEKGDSTPSQTLFSAVCNSTSGFSEIKTKLRKPSTDESTLVISSTTEILNTNRGTLNGLSCTEVNFTKGAPSNQQVLNASEIDLHLAQEPHLLDASDMEPGMDEVKKQKRIETQEATDVCWLKQTHISQNKLRHLHDNEDSQDHSSDQNSTPPAKLKTPSQKNMDEHEQADSSDSGADSDSDSDSSFSEYSVSDRRSCLPQYLPDDYLPHFLHRGQNAKLKHYWTFGESPEICIGSFCKLKGPDNLLEGRLFAEDLAFLQLKKILNVQSSLTNLEQSPDRELYHSEGDLSQRCLPESPALAGTKSKATKHRNSFSSATCL